MAIQICVFYGVFGLTPECFDFQMLFDPFEKQLDFPTVFVEQSNFDC